MIFIKNIASKEKKEQFKHNLTGNRISRRKENINRIYNLTVDKINFMVDGMHESKNLIKYLVGELPDETTVSITERELAVILVRESNFKKTTFYYQGKPIPFSKVKDTLNLPVTYN